MADFGIGICIGNTSSSVSVAKEGKADVVANDLGERGTPVVVAMEDGETVVGRPAKINMIRNASNTASYFFNLLGQRFGTPEVAHKPRTCTVVNKNDRANLQLSDVEAPFSPEHLTSLVLSDLRKTAEAQTSATVTSVVVAIPVNYAPEQVEALRQAASLAKMQIKRTISEPIAAVLAYGLGQDDKRSNSTAIVYNMGAANVTVTLVHVRGGLYADLGSIVDESIGGDLFDETFVQFLSKEFLTKTKTDITGNKKAVLKLSLAAEETKHVLSARSTASCSVESLFEGTDFQSSVMRTRFDMLCSGLFRKALGPVQLLLEKFNVSVEEISHVVLAGGAARMPKIKTALGSFFGGRDIVLDSIPADEVIANGAALQSLLLSSVSDEDSANQPTATFLLATNKDLLLRVGSEYKTVVLAGTPVPLRRTFTVATSGDNQLSMGLNFFEASSVQKTAPDASTPTALASLNMHGLPAGLAGEVSVVVTVEFSKVCFPFVCVVRVCYFSLLSTLVLH